MRKHHPKNERVKHQYFTYLEDARRMSASTVDQVAAAIAQFEMSTGHRDFAAFHYEQARKFKRMLDEGINPETGKPLAMATIYSRLMAVKAFFVWLAGQPGYRSKLTYSDMEYFNLSNNDGRIAKATGSRPAATLGQVHQVVMSMAAGSEVERRNRALIAFAIVSGARDDAIASMLVRHVDLANRAVFHDARQVRSKNRKTFTSIFFPVGQDLEQIVVDWISFLTKDRLFSLDDPLFPATKVKVGESGLFESAGLDRVPWRNATAIRRIFREAFEAAGLPYYNPHSFRKTLGALGERICETPEAMKAWSQNLSHDSVLTTFTSYGAVQQERQAEIFSDLNRRINARPNADESDPESIRKVVAWMQRKAL
jgi:integrase